MTKRKAIGKRARFEVFKRDSFACQYCGKAAPDVILHVDHIHPVSDGGDNDIRNLITACLDCNGGKGATKLADDTAIQKQRAQLVLLNERREQLEMMLKWRDGMQSLETQGIEAFEDAFQQAAPGQWLTDTGRKQARALIKKFGLQGCLAAIDAVGLSYVKLDAAGKAIPESASLAFSKIGGTARMAAMPEDRRQLYYIRGILRNRLAYLNHTAAISIMQSAMDAGGEVEELTRLAKGCRSWTQFADWVGEYEAELRRQFADSF